MGASVNALGKDSQLGKLMILTGGPGTGKTYTVRPIFLSFYPHLSVDKYISLYRYLSIYEYVYIHLSV